MSDLAGSQTCFYLGTEGGLIWEFWPITVPSSAHASSIPCTDSETWPQIHSPMP
jgi:hypothetical protein